MLLQLGRASLYTAGRFFAFYFRKQPHREHHEKPEERHEVLNTVMAEGVLHVERNNRHKNDYKR